MTGLITYLSNVWPVLVCLVILGILTYGSIMPYIRKDRQRRLEEDKHND